MTRRLKLKKDEINWLRVKELCYQSKLGGRLREADQSYLEAAHRADPVKYGEVSIETANKAVDDYKQSLRKS